MRDLVSTGAVTDGARQSERLGHASQDRPEGCLLWVHARTTDQCGASLAIAQELARLRGEAVHTLVTTQEHKPLPSSLMRAALHQLAPNETIGSINRFFDHWSPDLGLTFGQPDRRNLFEVAHRRNFPLFLAYADRRTTGSLTAFPPVFTKCFAPSAAIADALRAKLPAVQIEVSGPVSDTAIAPLCAEEDHDELSRHLAGRPTWLALGTTPAELPIVLKAQRTAFRAAHRMLLIVIPQLRADIDSFASVFEKEGWQIARYDKNGDLPDEDIQVVLADEDPGLWMRLAPITFLGGSFDPSKETADPFDPASLGSAILAGPEDASIRDRLKRLKDADAVVELSDPSELGPRVVELLAPDKAAVRAQAGWAVVTESAQAIEQVAAGMDLALDEAEDLS